MTPYEVMLSESQERMLVVVERGREARVRAIFDRWGLTSTIIGEITDDGRARIYDGADLVCDASIADLAEAPEYTPPSAEPRWLAALQQADLSHLPAPGLPMNDVLLRLLQSPNVASKRPVFRQYDHQVIDNTVIPPGADAALLRVKGTRKGLAFTTDGNGRFCHLDPLRRRRHRRHGGGPQPRLRRRRGRRRHRWPQLRQPRKAGGLLPDGALHRRHGRRLQRPRRPPSSAATSASTTRRAASRSTPLPIVGALGLLEEIDQRCSPGFKDAGDLVYVIGGVQGGPANLAGSEYLAAVHERVEGRPAIDLGLEMRAQRLCLDAIRAGKLRSAHDCSLGGLAVAAAVCCSIGNIGLGRRPLSAASAEPVDQAAILFGEAQSRIVISANPDDGPWLEAGAREGGRPAGAHRRGRRRPAPPRWCRRPGGGTSRGMEQWTHAGDARLAGRTRRPEREGEHERHERIQHQKGDVRCGLLLGRRGRLPPDRRRDSDRRRLHGGATSSDPTYHEVCTDRTGHAEVVQVEYDPEKVSYEQIVDTFWNIHDPTQLNRQGPDFGSQYRTAIFYHDDEQQRVATTARDALQAAKRYGGRPVVTQIEPVGDFWVGEDYHQQYLEKRGLASCHVSLK